MKKLFALLAFLAALFAAPAAFAQAQATVTGTVLDPTGIPYANAMIKAQIEPTGPPAPCVITGGNCVPIQGTVGPIPLSVAGSFTMNLYPNSLITPSGTQWLFTVSISPGGNLPLGTGPQTFSVPLTISAGSQDISSALNAAALNLSNITSVPPSLVKSGLLAQYRMLPSETPGALVDYSGNGNNAVGTIGSSPPTIIAGTGGLNFTGGGAVTLPAVLNSALTIQIFATYNAANYVSNPQANTYLILGSDASHYIGLSINQSNDAFDPWGPPCAECSRLRSVSPGNTYKNSSLNPVVGTNLYTLAMAATDELYIGADQVTYYQNSFSSAGLQTAGQYELGGTGTGNQFLGQMYYAVFYNRVLTAAEIQQNTAFIEANLATRGIFVATTSVLNQNRLVAAGDSITQQPPSLPYGWPEDSNFTLNGTWVVANAGVSGYKTYDMNAAFAAGYGPLYDKSGNDALIVFGGANNLSTNGEQSERDICYQAHVTGFRCLIATALDQTGNDAGKNAFNGQMREDWASWADGLIDIAANPNLGANGASTNSTYFQADGVHPTQAGTDLIASIMARITNRIYGNRNFTTATTYTATATQADADQYAILGGTSSGQTYTLETCIGWSTQNIYLKNTDTNSWTVAAAPGELIDGSASVTLNSGAVLTLQDVLTSQATGGCSWTVQGSSSANASVTIPPTILQNYNTNVPTNISVTANTVTTVLTQPVTMPSTGCPCRAIVSYGIYASTNNQTWNTWVSDGTNTFSSAQATGTGTNNIGLNSDQLSPVTYGNGASETFTLYVEVNGTGATVTAAPTQGNGNNSWMNVSIVTSQIDGLDQFGTFHVAAATAFPIGPLTPASLSEEPIALVVGDDGGGLPTVNAGSGATSALGTSMGGGNILTAAIASPITVNATATTSVNMASVLALLKLNGTFTIVQHPTPINTTGTSTPLAFGTNLTAGNTVIAFLWASGAAGSSSSASITDTQGNYYQQIGTIYEPSGGSHSAIQATMFLATNVRGGADTLTFKTGSSFTYGTITEMEVSGVQP